MSIHYQYQFNAFNLAQACPIMWATNYTFVDSTEGVHPGYSPKATTLILRLRPLTIIVNNAKQLHALIRHHAGLATLLT